MKKVTINDVVPFSEEINRRGLSDPLGTTNLALNHYRIAPGEGFPGGLHTHMDQEEVFLIISGEATFETMDGEVTVSGGEAIRFGPGEFQSGKNEADRQLVAFAIGAPRNTKDTRIPVECPECGHDDVRLEFDGDGITFVCPNCGSEYIPQDCPECESDNLQITLDVETRTVIVCQSCGTKFEKPPLRDG